MGVPIIRTIVYRGLNWGPLTLGNYHIVMLVPMVILLITMINGSNRSNSDSSAAPEAQKDLVSFRVPYEYHSYFYH